MLIKENKHIYRKLCTEKENKKLKKKKSEMTDLPCEIVSGYGLINCYLNEIKRAVLILRHHLDAHFMV